MNIEEKILSEISGKHYRSGEEISGELDITRSAVWKHIVKLRNNGYEIEASPRHGYRLVSRPDKLLSVEIAPRLRTRVVGRRIVHLEETGSTADEARVLMERGTPEGTVVIAESQKAGRGRMGRGWSTPGGKAIAMSVIFYSGIVPTRVPLFSLATAVAAAQAIAVTADVRPGLKWPNDIYLEGSKLGGVLVEMGAELDRVRWIIDSIGINVNNSFRGTELEASAVSLAEVTGTRVSRKDLAVALLGELDRLWLAARSSGGLDYYREEFLRLDILQGKKIRVETPEGTVGGSAAGIDGEGRLLLERPGGETLSLFSGEVTIAGNRPAG